MAGRTAGELGISAGGAEIGDVGRDGPAYYYTHTSVRFCPLFMISPTGGEINLFFDHRSQLLNPATEEIKHMISYQTATSATQRSVLFDTTLAGEWADGPCLDNAFPRTGKIIDNPAYDGIHIPRISLVTLSYEAQNDIGTAEVQAEHIAAHAMLAEDATELPYEVTCTDPGMWTVFGPNRSCSAYLMKYILAQSYNKLAATSVSAQTVSI